MNAHAETMRESGASVAHILARHAGIADFFAALGLPQTDTALPLADWLERLPDETLLDAGMERGQIHAHIERLLLDAAEPSARDRIERLTLLGGQDKTGQREDFALTLVPGDVVCVVGPTGSGKSRLLADVECLAQGDTPTGRRILIDDAPPDEARRFAPDKKLVTQLSQNMNFVVDMGAHELIAMHAGCRGIAQADAAAMADRVIACANELTGERFAPEVSVTQLSGGQTRALMIADAALLSASPVVLIDEIENAGVDRRRALELLTRGEKIVLISTHDPLLALRGRLRLVIRNGGVHEILETSAGERANLAHIETIDALLMGLRERIRCGQRIEEAIPCPVDTEYPAAPHLEWLLRRRSCRRLTGPGPSDGELERMLRAAHRTPDFGSLHPYRFLAARGDGLARLGEAMRRAAIAAGKSEKAIARAPGMPGRAPLVIVAVASPVSDGTVSGLDQLLCAGSSVLMLQLAARALGYSSIWRSGWPMMERAMHDELGLDASEQIVGFLYVGVPDEPETPPEDPDPFSRLSWL
ncbi:MAG: nitroreductase family protein [Azoarcus sp.]|jgi:ABC-type lipoprotein export system ATPase subunit/nitroreductase|nr:nitroreductase family protein [Azoarcus sp.]